MQIEQSIKWGCPHCSNPVSKMLRSAINPGVLICRKCHNKVASDKLRALTNIISTPDKSTVYYPIENKHDFPTGKLGNAGVIFDHVKNRAVDMSDAYMRLRDDGFDHENITEKRLREMSLSLRTLRKYKITHKPATCLGNDGDEKRLNNVILRKKSCIA